MITRNSKLFFIWFPLTVAEDSMTDNKNNINIKINNTGPFLNKVTRVRSSIIVEVK